uniref:Uncharacterized protein n=1 Tax=viral metagenome TaxID=1070528 RepID=A0A6C0CRK1_9ZZZZ
MFFTNSSGRYQPYRTWKSGNGTYAARPGWSRPIPDSNLLNPAPGKANPIKHWRKQLQPYNNTSKTGVNIPFNAPGSTVYLGVNSDDCNCLDNQTGTGEVVNITDNKNVIFQNGHYEVGPNGSRVCITCNPEANIIKSGLTEKSINPVDANTQPQKKFSFSTKQYLKQKCKTYEQRLSGTQIAGVNYTANYNNANKGPQTLQASSCGDCPGDTQVLIIRKPSNRQFGVQGAVDSSSRIQRLKMNTINKAAASLKSEYGSAAANAAKYTSTGATPYFVKSKVNSWPANTAHHRDGNKTICDCD